MDGHKPRPKKMYVPWFPLEDEDPSFLSYIHQNLHHEIGEDVGFPDSSWSYMNEQTSFEKKENSDVKLHFTVLDEFYKNKDIDASRVQVLVHNGIVNLSGYVQTEREKRRAEEIVRKMDHVWDLENDLEVKDENIKRKGFDLPVFS